jgi:hypothetical protein
MRLTEIIERTTWAEVQASLLSTSLAIEDNLANYKKVFEELCVLEPSSTKMKILITKSVDQYAEETYIDVFGINGDPYKELEEIKDKDSEFSNTEVKYAIEFQHWAEWLGMEIEDKTFRTFAYPEIVARCLWEMTFIGFDQDYIIEYGQQLVRTVDEIKNMTEDEKKEKLILLEEVLKD